MATNATTAFRRGSLRSVSSITQTLTSGTSTPTTISCPSGKYLKLIMLGNNSSSVGTVGTLTVTVGTRDVITSSQIQGLYATTGTLAIGGTSGRYDPQQGGKNEDIIITPTGSTTNDIVYTYEVLEDDI